MTMFRFHSPGARGGSVVLSPDESHHLARVLRLAAGAEVVVFDGKGREWVGRVRSTDRAGAVVDLVAEREPVAEPAVHVTLAVALLKGAQMDDVVRDAVMLGAGAIVPVMADHVAASKPEREGRLAPAMVERWARVAIASAKQCGRAVVPSILPAASVDAIAQDAAFDERIICVEPSRLDASGGTEWPTRPTRAVVLVGPEGGWSSRELELAARARATRLSLGPRTLRAERAPIVALATLWARWG